MDENLPLLEKRKRKPDFIKCCETLKHLLSLNEFTYPSLREKGGQNGGKGSVMDSFLLPCLSLPQAGKMPSPARCARAASPSDFRLYSTEMFAKHELTGALRTNTS